VFAPNNGKTAVVAITVNLTSETVTFSGAQIIPNRAQTDNVFVAVPVGHLLTDLKTSGSSATCTGDTPTLFNLSHVCDGTVPPATTTTTEAETTTTDAPTTTTAGSDYDDDGGRCAGHERDGQVLVEAESRGASDSTPSRHRCAADPAHDARGRARGHGLGSCWRPAVRLVPRARRALPAMAAARLDATRGG
jgi:hypothetical protein